MQDRYAGDIGDYGKFALLRVMEAQGLTVGINWYLAKTLHSEIHDDGKYRIPAQYENLDPELSAALNRIFDLREARSVQALEQARLLASSLFVNEAVPREIEQRKVWHQTALARLADCDIVFMDPDNGMNLKSVKPGSQKSPKYVWLQEVSDYVTSGKSVILYNHRPRKKAKVYLAEYAARFSADPMLSGKHFFVMTFPRRSIRDYFIIPASQKHEKSICQAIQSLLDGPFGKSGFAFYSRLFKDLPSKINVPGAGFGLLRILSPLQPDRKQLARFPSACGRHTPPCCRRCGKGQIPRPRQTDSGAIPRSVFGTERGVFVPFPASFGHPVPAGTGRGILRFQPAVQ